jgi:hypothetical protein
MRAVSSIVAFLSVSALAMPAARAHVPLFTPRVSLSLALDWNALARRAHAAPAPQATIATTRRHTPPRLPLISVTPRPASAVAAPIPSRTTLETVAVGRVEGWARMLVTPSVASTNPNEAHRLRFRSVYAVPSVPYLGAYIMTVNVESDVLR